MSGNVSGIPRRREARGPRFSLCVAQPRSGAPGKGPGGDAVRHLPHRRPRQCSDRPATVHARGVRDHVGVGCRAPASRSAAARATRCSAGELGSSYAAARCRLGPFVEQAPGQEVAPPAVRGRRRRSPRRTARADPTPTSSRRGRRRRRERHARRPGRSGAPRRSSRHLPVLRHPRRDAGRHAGEQPCERATLARPGPAGRAMSWPPSSRRRSCLVVSRPPGSRVIVVTSWCVASASTARCASCIAVKRPPVSIAGPEAASPASSVKVSAMARSRAARSGSGSGSPVVVPVGRDADEWPEAWLAHLAGAARKSQRHPRDQPPPSAGWSSRRDPNAAVRTQRRPLSWGVDNSTGGLHP